MKKILLSLMAVAMCGASFAQDYKTLFTKDFEDGNSAFTARSRATVSIGTDATLNSNVQKFTNAKNAQNGYSFSDFNFKETLYEAVDVVNKMKIEFDYYNNANRDILTIGDADVRGTTGGSSKVTYNNAGAIFSIGSNKSNALINGASYKQATFCKKWLHVTVNIDLDNAVYGYEIKDKVADTVIVSTNDTVAYVSAKATKCTQIDEFGYINSADGNCIDNITVSYVGKKVPKADFKVVRIAYDSTIKDYASLKDTVTYSGVIGEVPALLDSLKESIYTNDNKYIFYKNLNASDTVKADGSTLIKLQFRKGKTYTATAISSLGDTLSTTPVFEADGASLYFPYYIMKDGVLYDAGDVSNGTKNYGQINLSAVAQNETSVVTYTEDENQNCVYYSEAEEVPTLTAFEDGYTEIRQSNGKVGYAPANGTVITTLAPGKYTLTSATRAGTPTFTVNGEAVLSLSSSGNTITTTSDEFLVAKECPLTVSAGSSKNYFDYVLIRKTGDVNFTQQAVNIDVEGDASGVEYTESFTNKNVYFEKNEDGTYNVVLPELKSEKYNCTMAGASFINFDPTSAKALTKAIGVTNGEKTDSIKNITVVAFTNDEENDFYLKLHGDVVGDKEGTIDVVYSANMLNTNNIANFDEYTLDPESVKYFENEDAAEEPVKTWKSGGYTFSTYTADYGDWGKYYYSYAISDKTTTDSKLYNYALESACGGAVSGSNYAVWYDNAYNGGDSIKLDTPAQINGFYVTNTTSVVDAILNGDGMSVEADGTKGKPFGYGNANDELTLSVIGYKNGKETGVVDFKLAYTEEGTIYYAKDWMWFDLTSLGVVDCVKTTMSSTKANAYGMTSPTYFCMDDLGGNAPEYAAEYASYNPTAVNSVNAAANKVMNGKFFKNGQVIIVKNGKQYNAAGAQMK